MQLIPAIDVLAGRVVRLRQGRANDPTEYGNDPIAQLLNWGKQGASLVHVVDLTGAIEGVWNGTLWGRLGQTAVPFQAGGGIRSVKAALDTISAGASRVVLGSTAVWDPARLRSIVDAIDTGRVVAAVDVRDGRAVGAGWVDEGRPLDEVLDQLAEAGIIRALVTGIVGDGMLSGPDIDLLVHCFERVPEVNLIASGGVGSLDDLRKLRLLPLEGVIIGRALFEGAFTLDEGRRVLGS